MLAAERRNMILEKLQEEKKVVVNELSLIFQVSEETIRRDLDKLDKEGLAVKSYGGAVINENNNIDLPFNVRKKKNALGKRKIAEIVERMIRDGDSIILDASSTAVFIAKELKSKERLTVITNSIEVLVELSDVSGWDIISCGGSMKEKSLALVGPKTVEGLQSYNADKLIMSCKGIDLEKGVTDTNELFAEVKRAMIKSVRLSILAVDNSKFDKVAFLNICENNQIDIVITDKKPEPKWLEYFEKLDIECVFE